MRDFFKGWRRKVGCVTLVMATALAVLWGRTMFVADIVRTGHAGFGSLRGGMYLFGVHEIDAWDWQSVDEEEIQSVDGNKSLAEILAADASDGLVYGYALYWWLILPLTLLSAYLILWKPRKRTEPGHA